MSTVTYSIDAVQDDTPVRGNAMASGDDALDKQVEDEILARLDAGDVWAWASVEVTASLTVDGVTFSAAAYLGCCSYKDEEGFKAGGYWEDMQKEALENLARELGGAVARGESAARALAVLEGGGA